MTCGKVAPRNEEARTGGPMKVTTTRMEYRVSVNEGAARQVDEDV